MKSTIGYRIRSWLPAFLVMTLIFIFSATPSSGLPDFGWWDLLVKKGAHFSIYALLVFTFLRGFHARPVRQRILLSLGCALLYAVSDEFHQSFTAGRRPSPVDVVIDLTGGLCAALIWQVSLKVKQLVVFGVVKTN